MKYVIIGNSIAATNAIKSIREFDKENKIILISDEEYINYSRPLISYLLAKKITKEKINYLSTDFYEKNKVDLILKKKAVKILINEKSILLNDNTKINYDKLLLTTGGTPIIPQIKGINTNGIFNFTKISDVEKIEKYIKENNVKKVSVIGAGLIGLKATEALLELKLKVTIIELSDRILASTLDKKASAIFENELRKNGCEIITNTTVKEIITENNKVKELSLINGTRKKTDMIIIAIGVKPNIELVKETEIKINRGILVNSKMETNIENIYAAGDCAEPTIESGQ
ncbi:MAG TPA: FAD-dependent oxidoreductase [bacterium]|nr:FAD-dependent oxidoreductase [bacterium]